MAASAVPAGGGGAAVRLPFGARGPPIRNWWAPSAPSSLPLRSRSPSAAARLARPPGPAETRPIGQTTGHQIASPASCRRTARFHSCPEAAQTALLPHQGGRWWAAPMSRCPHPPRTQHRLRFCWSGARGACPFTVNEAARQRRDAPRPGISRPAARRMRRGEAPAVRPRDDGSRISPTDARSPGRTTPGRRRVRTPSPGPPSTPRTGRSRHTGRTPTHRSASTCSCPAVLPRYRLGDARPRPFFGRPIFPLHVSS